MVSGSLKVKLRPLRLAFLVQPTDKAAIANAIETASFLWGGAFSPIIPVYRKLPKYWGRDSKRGLSAQSVVEGYLDAFDPDYVVKVGRLEADDLKFGHRAVIKCSEITGSVEEDGTPKFGIGMFEVLRYFAQKELEFVRHRPLRIRLPEFSSKNEPFLASVFGSFSPAIEKLANGGWKDLPGVETAKCTIDNYFEFLSPDNLFLRRIGTINIQTTRVRSFRRRDCIFLMNPDRALDIIDYWNLRALGWNVIPICQQVVDNPGAQKLAVDFVEENSFAYRGNPNLFNNTMILRSRTSSIVAVEELGRSLKPKLSPSQNPHESKIVYHLSYPRIWDEWAREKDSAEVCDLEVFDEEYDLVAQEKAMTFKTLMPEFASRHGGHSKPRCANEIEIRVWGDENISAEVVPEGDWQLAGAAGAFGFDEWRCGQRGLIHLAKYKNWRERLNLSSATSVFSAWLRAKGWTAEISNNGHIARHMLRHLGGTFGVGLLAKRSVIELLQQFASGRHHQEKGETSNESRNDLPEEEFGRAINIETFKRALNKITGEDRYKMANSEQLAKRFIEQHMFELGFKLQCPECRQRSWFSIKDADYEIKCPQCLARFKLPQHNPKEISWAYRTIGPFSLPHQAYGVYSVLLTLRFFARLLDGATTPMFSFTAKKGASSMEIDLGLFYQSSKYAPSRTELIFAECKTFGHFKRKDSLRMISVSKEFPGAVLVFATLRDSLTEDEKTLLRPVVNRGRRYWKSERPYNPVLILTGNELFADGDPRQHWKELGGIHETHSHTWGGDRDIVSLADDTQQIYLGMKPWHESVIVRRKADGRKENLQTGTPPPIAYAGPSSSKPNPGETITVSFPVAMRQVPWR